MKKTAIILSLLSACFSLSLAETVEVDTTKQATPSLLTYDENHIISVGDHNHQEFFDMVRDL